MKNSSMTPTFLFFWPEKLGEFWLRNVEGRSFHVGVADLGGTCCWVTNHPKT